MRLKLYRAPTVAEAMARVRAELGPEALILGSRPLGEGIELTAALETADPVPLRVSEPPSFLDYHSVPGRLRGALSHADLGSALAKALRFGVLPVTGRPLLMVGPPGGGKTLTVVRLATRLVMAGVTPAVIAADGNKPGATEQLSAFTRLLDLRLTEASDPLVLAKTRAQQRGGAPVLIDGPGTDPFQSDQADRLCVLIAASGARAVLVLPAGLDPAEAADLAQAYAAIGAEYLIATRLDTTRRLGGILAAADAGRLTLTEAGIGSGAADGLVPMTPAFFAARLQQTGTPRHVP